MIMNIKTATEMITNEIKIYCPHCHTLNDGFIGDPRGGVFVCDECDEEFKIHSEADIEIQ